jgi:rhodanese-related sulfurtransferase
VADGAAVGGYAFAFQAAGILQRRVGHISAALPGKGQPPHDHTTWAIIAGVQGNERNVVYGRQPTDDPAQDRLVNRVVFAGNGGGSYRAFAPPALMQVVERLVPNRGTRTVLVDADETRAHLAAAAQVRQGWLNVSVLAGGTGAWFALVGGSQPVEALAS